MAKSTGRYSKYLLCIATAIFIMLALIFSHIKNSNHELNKGVSKVDPIAGTILPVPRVLGPFHMSDVNGKPFDLHSLRGHWSMIFFGYTHCHTVCSSTMAALNDMYNQLQQKKIVVKKLPHVIFISIDPKRDNAVRLKAYMKSYNPNFLAVFGGGTNLHHIAEEFNVVYSKIPLKGQSSNGLGSENYDFRQSADVMVVSPHMRLVAFLSYPHDAAEMARDYITLLSRYSKNTAVW